MQIERILLVMMTGLATGIAVGQQPGDRETIALRPLDRFEGEAQVRAKDGMAPLRVALRNWIIPNNTRVAPFPERAFMVMQLRAGELATIINGERKSRHADEFWTVPENAQFAIETGKDFAIVQSFAVSSGAKP